MTKCLKLFAVLLGVLLLPNCDCQSCDPIGGTMESKTKDYKGKAGATAPYTNDEPELWVRGGACDAYTKQSTYWIVATVWLHNPTKQDVTADVHCKFLLGDWEGATGKRLGIRLPYGSKRIELQQNFEVQCGQGDSISIQCETYWR